MSNALVESFAAALRPEEGPVDLLDGALHVARIGGRTVDDNAVRRELDLLANSALAVADGKLDTESLAHAIDHEMFTVAGFRGNTTGYYEPENSFVDSVLQRRTGIPITLCLVYVEVARRVGLTCDGIGYPGHFIVRCGGPETAVYVDPYHQGSRLDREELLAGLRDQELGGTNPESYVAAVTPRQVIQRMLYNLFSIYRQRAEHAPLLTVVEMLLRIEPWNTDLIGERGLVLYATGDHARALDDLETYVRHSKGERVAPTAWRAVRELRALRAESEHGHER